MSGVEWAGGVGLADRDAQHAGHRRHALPRRLDQQDVHRRRRWCSCTRTARSISTRRSSELASEVRIDNAWDGRRSGARDPPAAAHRRLRRHALQRDVQRLASGRPAARRGAALNPASRVVRWQPGTRMSYSNPGYAHRRLPHREDHRREVRGSHRRAHLQARRHADEQLRPDRRRRRELAKGYRDRTGPPVPYTQIYLRPVRQSAHLGRSSSASSCTCC